jgi:glycosyltransferase involved in cell wall biosynthesis
MKINKLKEADIIHIHWVNEGIWSHTFANKLNKVNKPIVWTIHDMWTFTGGCHYTEKCDLYYYGCGKCPILNSKRKRDISFKESKWKKGWIRKANIRFVGCSNWITNEFNKSEIGKSGSKEAICIPNPAERKSFCCLDRIACKEILKINTKKKIILFGAMSAISDKRKGFEQLVGAIKELSNEQYAVAIFGNDCDDYKNIKEKINEYEVIDFGIIKNDISLSMIYNIADVFIAPSLQENLANTVMESLLCGTPVVAFDIGGMSDMIINKINGYLATPFDKKDLAKGIEYVCKDNEDKIDRLKISEETNRRFNVETISKRYIKVYNELLSRV